MTIDLQLMIQLAYALGVGVLIGLERSLVRTLACQPEQPEPEAQQDKDSDPDDPRPGGEFLGVRTFAVLSVTGFGAALASEQVPFVAPVVLLGVSAMVIVMYLRAVEFDHGITTEAAAIGACTLGILCRSHPHAAGVLALCLTVLLAAKGFTHATISKMRRVELTDTLKFLVVILIVLPLLPNEALDPYGAFNPYKVGFLVVLISGIGFVGYFLTRILGAQKGLGLTGILGGLTSSTAVTAAMAAEAKQTPALGPICAFSTLAANATMFVRVIVVVAVLDQVLVMRLAWSVGGMALTAAICSGVLWFVASRSNNKGDQGDHSVKLKNPFSVGPAIKFALFFVGILFVAKLAKLYFGDQGLFAAAGLSGLADVDAITLSIAEQTQGAGLDYRVGAIAITIAVVSNSVVKSGIAIYVGGWKFGRLVALCLGLATAVGLITAFVV